MKRILYLIILLIITISGAKAQNTPNLINYQAVAHNSNGDLLTNQAITVRIGIVSTSTTGTLQYEEDHSVTTNDYGLFALQIGGGTSTGNGTLTSMSAINWASDIHFLNIQIDAGNGLESLGAMQLISVPYALNAKSTEQIQNQNISSSMPNNGDIIVYNASTSTWEYQANSGGSTYTAGNGISITGTTIDNTGDLDPTNELELPTQTSSDAGNFLQADGVGGVIYSPVSGDNWGTDIVNTSGTNVSGDGTTANPLIVTETTSTLVDNTDGTFTYTNETGSPVTFNANIDDADADPANEIELPTQTSSDAGNFLQADGAGGVIYAPTTGDNWGTDIVNISGSNISGDGTTTNPLTVTETISTLIDNGDSTYTYTNESGAMTTINTALNDADADPNNEIELPIQTTSDAGYYLQADGAGNVSYNPVTSDGNGIYTGSGTVPSVTAVTLTDNLNFSNNTLYIDGISSNVGIGIGTPLGKLHTLTQGATNLLISHSISSAAADNSGSVQLVRARGSLGSESNLLNGDRLGSVSFNGYNTGTSNYEEGAYIAVSAEEDYNTTSHAAQMTFHTAPANGSVPLQAMVINSSQYVGIGDPSPSATLDINGTFQYTDGNQVAGAVLTSDGLGNATWQPLATPILSRIQDIDGNTFVETDFAGDGTDDKIRFSDAGTEMMIISNQTIDLPGFGQSVHIGNGAGLNSSISTNPRNVFIGETSGTANTSGSFNTAVGGRSLETSTSGVYNTAIGNSAMQYNTTGGNNTALGNSALINNSTGNFNTALGTSSLTNNTGSYNTAIGNRAGFTNTTGNNNVFIGYNADATANNLTNAGAIGPNTKISQSNAINIGSGSTHVGINNPNPNNVLSIITNISNGFEMQTYGNSYTNMMSYIHYGGSVGSPTSTTAGNVIATSLYSGYGTTTDVIAAKMEVIAEANFTDAISPGAIVFSTTKSGNTFADEKMRISSNGFVGIATQSPTANLDVNGTFKLTDGTQGKGKILTSDPAGNASWKEGAVAFSVGGGNYGSATQSIAAGTTTRLQFDVTGPTHYDPNTYYSNTNNQFIAPVSGVYQLNTTLVWAGATSGYFTINMMSSTGNSLAKQLGDFNSTAQNWCTRTISVTVHLSAGESIWLEVLNNSGAMNFYTQNSTFSGHLVYQD